MPDEHLSEYETRVGKLNALIEKGISPYPAHTQRTHTSKDIIDNFEKIKKSEENVSAVGRIRIIRRHGGSAFAYIEDGYGRIQVYFKKDLLSDQYKIFEEYIDVGDFIEVKGTVFVTKTEEKTIQAESFRLLAKSLQPVPEEWFGLKDKETRFRKRYLDLIMNEKVRENFRVRAKVISGMRQFLLDRDYLEVETPILQPIYGGGLAQPFKAYHNALGINLYMRISTELYLKRLTVGGFERVFEFGRVFRNEGVDKNHNPEFTILETMEAYADYKDNMKLVEEMTEKAVKDITGGTMVNYQGKDVEFKTPWKRMTMTESVKAVTGVDFSQMKNFKEAQDAAQKIGIELEKFHDSIGMIIAAVFEEKVEETLINPTIIYDFPVETSPLAKKCKDNPNFVERFEHFVVGMEGSNNYSELNDPIDLSERFKDERKKERLGDDEAHQTDQDFLEALEQGMPPTSGIGIGIDRLVMIITDSATIREVILFPTMKPKDV